MRHLIPAREASSTGKAARKHRRLSLRLMMAFFTCVTALALLASPARADDLTVNDSGDSGTGGCDAVECTLREAINAANTNGKPDTITFNLSDNSTITLTSGQLTIGPDYINNGATANELTIEGPGANNLAVSGKDSSRVFQIDSGAKAEIKGITIANGNGTEGGGIYVHGTLTLSNSTVSENRSRSGDGGGIYVDSIGTLTLTNSTVSSNRASNGTGLGNGGGVNSFGTLMLTNSTISGNSAGFGGGIYSATNLTGSKTTTIKNSTISGNRLNQADGRGGGIRNSVGLTALENSTITNNTAPVGRGGGVASRSDAATRTEVRASIIAANELPDGSNGTDVDSGATATPNTFQSNGSNLIGDGNATGNFSQTKNDQIGVAPKLDTLGDNGGPTQTHALQAGSPAIDAVQPMGTLSAATVQEGCGVTEDQRGVSRPQDGDGDGTAKCDIGSFELKAAAVDLTPETKDYGNQEVDTRSDPQTFTVKNTGEANLDISTVSIQGTDSGDFTKQNDNCENQTVAPGSSCTVEAVFSPRSTGDKSVVLRVQSNASTTPDEIQLKGSGTAVPTPPPSDPSPSDPPPSNPPPSDPPPSNPPPTTKPPVNNPNACTIKGNSGNNILRGTPGRDVICGFGGNDVIRGLGGNDLIKGGSGNDILYGQGGNDVLYGGAGRDRLLGQRGNDALFGGTGRDVLLGGPGKNVLNGGAGKDVERGGVTPSKADDQARKLMKNIFRQVGL